MHTQTQMGGSRKHTGIIIQLKSGPLTKDSSPLFDEKNLQHVVFWIKKSPYDESRIEMPIFVKNTGSHSTGTVLDMLGADRQAPGNELKVPKGFDNDIDIIKDLLKTWNTETAITEPLQLGKAIDISRFYPFTHALKRTIAQPDISKKAKPDNASWDVRSTKVLMIEENVDISKELLKEITESRKEISRLEHLIQNMAKSYTNLAESNSIMTKAFNHNSNQVLKTLAELKEKAVEAYEDEKKTNAHLRKIGLVPLDNV
jgi:hypothetical protein